MKIRSTSSSRRGGALLVALLATLVLAALAAGMLATTDGFKSELSSANQRDRALYVAEAGLSDGIASLTAGAPQNAGSQGAPVAFSGGGYWCTVVDNGNETFTITSSGVINGDVRTLEALMRRNVEGVFASAVFAGNSSGDPLYDLKFGGVGVQADQITGNIYSGNNVRITGDAAVTGAIKAGGSISGGSGQEGKSLPIPDMAGMNYAATSDFNVASLFAGASYATSGMGGKAWQVPSSNPAHIFRKNPDDRATDTSKTAKDDYFLEDPYETLNGSSTVDYAHSTKISLSGVGGAAGPSATNKVFYIDGNLWIHNRSAYSFGFASPDGTPLRVTFVVKGNIYISDNILYQDKNRDAVALIAVKDASHVDSGNIYFGDPVFGTLEEMNAFMYAENNFLDTNLNASGSAKVKVVGNMTAGNQVKINRDFGTQHSKLTVDFDPRLSTGTVSLPGLPKSSGAGTTWQLVAWRELAAP